MIYSKISLRKEINSLTEYMNDLQHECKNQFPQPNGDIYLHGEVIRPSILWKTCNELNKAILAYNTVCNKQLPFYSYDSKTLINKHTCKHYYFTARQRYIETNRKPVLSQTTNDGTWTD